VTLHQEVVIIGAPRSGTNMLRDLLCSGAGVASWPCDEINYIWRHGNTRCPSDALTAGMARPWIRDYIRGKFQWVRQRYAAPTVVEKTCANSVRVGFVECILGAPKYIFIHRDGLDAAASAIRRWTAGLDYRYVLRKARFVPVTDLPRYGIRYLGNRVSRLWSAEGRLSSWGPVVPEMNKWVCEHDLPEICALQWQACVERSLQAFEDIPPERVSRVSYETLVTNYGDELPRIADFLDLDAGVLLGASVRAGINADSIGKARRCMPRDTLARMAALIDPTRQRLGYR